MRNLILSFLLALNSYLLFAQTVDIRGTVYGESGEPIKQCQVFTSQHKIAVTDSLGSYSVVVPIKGKTEITFKHYGYKDVVYEWSKELGDNPVDIRMKIDTTARLDEIVISTFDLLPLCTPYDDGYYLLHRYGIPEECDEIVIYTQFRRAKNQEEIKHFGNEPYLSIDIIRFQDSTTKSVGIIKRIKERRFSKWFQMIPIEKLSIEGFHLLCTDVGSNDPVAQEAPRKENDEGLQYYGKRDTPVCYFKRDGK